MIVPELLIMLSLTITQARNICILDFLCVLIFKADHVCHAKIAIFFIIRLVWGLSNFDEDHVNSSSDTLRHHPHSLTPTCRAARLRWLRYLDKPEYESFYTSPFGAVVIVPVSAKAAGFCSLLRTIMVARWNGVAYAIQAQDSRGYQIHRINLHMDIFTYERGVYLFIWNEEIIFGRIR